MVDDRHRIVSVHDFRIPYVYSKILEDVFQPLVHSLFAHAFFEHDLKEPTATRAAAHSGIDHVIYRHKDLVDQRIR